MISKNAIRLLNICKSDYMVNVLILLVGIIATAPYVYSIFYFPVSADSSYYLSIIEHIREGEVPYRDFVLGYTPFFFYIMAWVKSTFAVGVNFGLDLLLYAVWPLVTVWAMIKIVLLLTDQMKLALFSAFFFLIVSYWFAKYDFLLEFPSVCFGMWAIYFTLKYPQKCISSLLVGVLCGLAFMVKQYGLGYFFLVLFWKIINKTKILDTLYLVFSFTLVCIIAFSLFPKLIENCFFSGYGFHSNVSSVSKIGQLMTQIVYYLIHIPILAPVVIYSFFLSTFDKKINLLFLLGIIGFLCQFYFAPFAHYLIYVLPFVSIHLFVVLLHSKSRFYLCVLIVMESYFIFRIYSKLWTTDVDLRQEQNKIARSVTLTVKDKSLYITDSRIVEFYYLTGLKPPFMNYSFGAGIDEKDYYKSIVNADYVLIYDSPIVYDFNLNTKRVQQYLKKCSVKQILSERIVYDNAIGKSVSERIVLLEKNKKEVH